MVKSLALWGMMQRDLLSGFLAKGVENDLLNGEKPRTLVRSEIGPVGGIAHY
jgi:hypothetical protein